MSVTQTHDAIWSDTSAPREQQLSSIRGTLVKTLAVQILMLLVNIFGALELVGATIGMATEDHFTGLTLYFGYLADGLPAALFIAGAVLTAVMAIRTWRMLSAANAGDVAALRKLSSLGWAVIGMIFSWVVPGVLLLRVNRSIRATAA